MLALVPPDHRITNWSIYGFTCLKGETFASIRSKISSWVKIDVMNRRHTSLWILAISIKSHSCQQGSNGYNALHNAIHNWNQSQRYTIDIFMIGTYIVTFSCAIFFTVEILTYLRMQFQSNYRTISNLRPLIIMTNFYSHYASHSH